MFTAQLHSDVYTERRVSEHACAWEIRARDETVDPIRFQSDVLTVPNVQAVRCNLSRPSTMVCAIEQTRPRHKTRHSFL